MDDAVDSRSRTERPLWRDVPRGRRRLPDPVRGSAVRAGLIASVTLVVAMVALMAVVAGTWFAGPAVLTAIVATVVTTWAMVDVLVTRQTWAQRAGVVSSPSSAVRESRRQRRRAAREAERADLHGAGHGRLIPRA
ncbi:hypothetical protein POF50_022630 [Streptomyces sp. SL13]|uniref:Uncharacterized protein n=1 Tax=Streptantibioticus silvisoli TaxID=2705255 RepID=A0AA90H2B4_9ACTN|nr:hypothetical protein [Streptantibioticus silvisoli]MDI5966700.1 hypothetical protein [Streptantibioticus silvisoli]MDI5972099.1 hypothetical protein [Streptantibioticus silvisoli]